MSTKSGWLVRTFDGHYLFPDDDGDVGMTPEMSKAGVFDSYGEAHEAAVDHCDPGFTIVPSLG